MNLAISDLIGEIVPFTPCTMFYVPLCLVVKLRPALL